MSATIESLVHDAYVHHFGSVTASIKELDNVVLGEYTEAAKKHSGVPVESGTFDFYYTGDGYIDADGWNVSVHSAMPDSSNLIAGMPRPKNETETPSESIQQAYNRLTKNTSSDSSAALKLRDILAQTSIEKTGEGAIAVRRPLHVFRVADGYAEPNHRTRYAGDTVALPEIVNPDITRKIGEQVTAAQYTLDSLVENPRVAEAASAFQDLHHKLSRANDSRDSLWAPLRTYKEGVVTAAQSISFLSEGITDADDFAQAVDTWKADKTIETLASSLDGAVLGPLATHGAQPIGTYVRSEDGALRQDLKAAIQTKSRTRKQRQLALNVNSIKFSGVSAEELSTIPASELAEQLIDNQNFFLPGWGCLAPAATIRHVTDIALARL